MSVARILFYLFPRRIVVRKRAPMKEKELDLALGVAEENELWRAIHQLIDTAEENANSNAAVQPPEAMSGYVGGAEHLRLLREELERRRTNGIELRNAPKPEAERQ